ncbi:MAG: hypothetical protein BGO67_03085 [Alphaproteobacteria bacterium 41-28]|nr:MAG: hypothetical protein BGO67_03085 [Alphaproteobacteria bacterium 41-28]
MNKGREQDSMKEMLNILKGHYSAPTKLWIWGKVIKEWSGIILGGGIFIFAFFYIIFSISGSVSHVQYVNGSQQPVVLPMKDIVKFMAICQRSINKRQEILESLRLSRRLLISKRPGWIINNSLSFMDSASISPPTLFVRGS